MDDNLLVFVLISLNTLLYTQCSLHQGEKGKDNLVVWSPFPNLDLDELIGNWRTLANFDSDRYLKCDNAIAISICL